MWTAHKESMWTAASWEQIHSFVFEIVQLASKSIILTAEFISHRTWWMQLFMILKTLNLEFRLTCTISEGIWWNNRYKLIVNRLIEINVIQKLYCKSFMTRENSIWNRHQIIEHQKHSPYFNNNRSEKGTTHFRWVHWSITNTCL